MSNDVLNSAPNHRPVFMDRQGRLAHSNVPRTYLHQEQARLLYAGIPVALTVNALIATILLSIQHSVFDTEPIIIWSTLLGVTLVVRSIFAITYERAQMDASDGNIWLNRFRMGVAATGIAWGLTAVLLFPVKDILHQSFLAFALAGMTAGAVTLLSCDLVSALAFIVPALVPLIARMFMEGTEIQVAMGAMGALYLVALTLTAWRSYLNILDNICLEFEAVAREKHLRENEAQLIKAQEVAQTGSWHLDIATGSLTCSPEFYRIFDILPEAPLTHEAILGHIHPDDRGEIEAAWKAALQGAPYDIEHRIVANGELRWVRERAQIEFDPAFRPLAALGTIQDITERKQIEEALAECEKPYRILFESSRDAIMTLTPDKGYLSGNAAAVALFGCRDEHEFIALSPALTSPEFQPDGRPSDEKAQEMMHAALQSGSNFFEWTYRRMDGTEFVAEVLLTRMEIPDRKMIQATVRDITGRKQAEEALRIAAIAFESQEGIIVTGANGVIMRVNQAFTRLTGYTAEEAVGQTPALLNSGRHGKGFYENMWATLKQKHHWQGEIWNRRKNGKIYAEWLNISAVTAPDGNITHYVGTFSNITNDPEASAEIHRLAYYDPLTHLPNRRLLLDRLGQALASSHRSGRYGALLFMDLDNFKKLNDTRGHDVGDQLLVEVANRLNACVREGDTVVRLGDTVVRLGGDEFILMLEDLGVTAQEAVIQASHVGEKVRLAIAQPYLLHGAEFSCTVSIGIAPFIGHHESVDNLLKYADLAMYHAKKGGRNRLSFFDPMMQAMLVEHSALENDLRHALERKQLHLHYQLQMDSEHQIAGAEALLRWYHPDRGLIYPEEFIPVAEESGLIIPIGLWALQKACTQIKTWSDKPATRELQLSVNVSVRQFHQPDFVAQVQHILTETGIDPKLLKIELTESLVLNDVTDTIAKMHELKGLGVSFSMDDFGTGYSSLSNLQQLPLNQLKIDQSFIRDLATNPNDAAIVQAIVTMGLAFGMNVIAEGVETEAQREFLDLHGCHAFQGYLFNKPMPIQEFETLIERYA